MKSQSSGESDTRLANDPVVLPEGHKLFVIATTARTGCSWFLDLLASTERLGIPRTFNPRRLVRKKETLFNLIMQTATPNKVCTLKVPADHLAELLDRVTPDLFLHYYRRDVVRQAISLTRSRQTRIWANHHNQQPQDHDRLTYSGQAIQDACQRHHKLHELIASKDPDRQLTYEDLVAAPLRCLRAIGRCLEVDIPQDVQLFSSRKLQSDELTEEWYKRFMAQKETPKRLRRLSRCDYRSFVSIR